MPPYQSRNSARANGIAEFVSKYWMYILGAIVVLPPALLYIKKLGWGIEKQKEEHEKDVHYRESKNPVKLQERLNKIFENSNATPEYKEKMLNYARLLAHYTGIAYSDTDSWWTWIDPRGWFEDDTRIFNTLIEIAKMQQPLGEPAFTYVDAIYYEITRKRSLTTDLYKFLDNDQMAQLKSTEYYSFL